jgi:hypothetical protein
MNKVEITKEARKRHPTTKPMNYFEEGRAMGFVEGAEWMQQLYQKLKDIMC